MGRRLARSNRLITWGQAVSGQPTWEPASNQGNPGPVPDDNIDALSISTAFSPADEGQAWLSDHPVDMVFFPYHLPFIADIHRLKT
jgi:hypothetical protein